MKESAINAISLCPCLFSYIATNILTNSVINITIKLSKLTSKTEGLKKLL